MSRYFRALMWLVLCPSVVCSLSNARAEDTATSPPDIVETVDGSDPGPVSEGDVTESIMDEGASEAASEPQIQVDSSISAPESSRTKVTGWARESLELYPYDEGLDRGDPTDVLHVRRDRLVSRTQLLVRSSYQRGSWFEATISGVLGVSAHVESSGQGLKVYELGSQGTDVLLDARLLELYLGFFSRVFDLRIGQQRVAWGVADILSPNDIVNARDMRDPFFAEPELLRLPTPLLRATLYGGPVLLELLASPLFVPDRTSLYARNWSAIQPESPSAYRGLFALLARESDPSVQDEINAALYQTRLPNRNGRGASAGAKLGLQLTHIDLNFYYHYGFDGTPYLWVNPSLFSVLSNTDVASAGLVALEPVLRAADAGVPLIVAEYVRRHHAGFDAVIPAGPFILRVDAAYQSQRVFYRADLMGFLSPAILSVLSLDYQTGSVDKLFVVEGVYVRVLERIPSPLLVYARDSYGVGIVTRWPLFSIFSAELRALVGVEPRFYMVQPALLLKASDFAVRLGALVSDGELNSLGWYYRHNTTALLQVRYGF